MATEAPNRAPAERDTIAEAEAERSGSRWLRGHIPGEEGIWVFIFGDMMVFALLFGVFLSERSSQVALFDRSRETLHVTFGAVNTLLLLTASLFVVHAMRLLRENRRELASRLIAGAGVCGVIFVVNKGLEYSDKISAGHGPGSNDFFMYFFILTGIHLLHLLIGLVVLTLMFRVARRDGELGFKQFRVLEAGASYWHLVDLLWVVLFALLYLVSGS